MPIGPLALATWSHLWGTGRPSGSSLLMVSANKLLVSVYVSLCAGLGGHCRAPGLTWPCPHGAHSQVVRCGIQTLSPVIGKPTGGTVPGWGQGGLPGRDRYLTPILLAFAFTC